MLALKFTCEVIHADGVLRRTGQTGYFESRKLLQEMLDGWSGFGGPNGGTYQYFESASDRAFNALAVVPFPKHHKYKWGTRLRSHANDHFNEMIFENDPRCTLYGFF